MTNERVTELTDIAYNAMMDMKKTNLGLREQIRVIKDLANVGEEYLIEILDKLPPVSNTTLPFMLAAMQIVTEKYMKQGGIGIEDAVKSAKKIIELKNIETRKDFID